MAFLDYRVCRLWRRRERGDFGRQLGPQQLRGRGLAAQAEAEAEAAAEQNVVLHGADRTIGKR